MTLLNAAIENNFCFENQEEAYDSIYMNQGLRYEFDLYLDYYLALTDEIRNIIARDMGRPPNYFQNDGNWPPTIKIQLSEHAMRKVNELLAANFELEQENIGRS
jgi:hypothetical protein